MNQCARKNFEETFFTLAWQVSLNIMLDTGDKGRNQHNNPPFFFCFKDFDEISVATLKLLLEGFC